MEFCHCEWNKQCINLLFIFNYGADDEAFITFSDCFLCAHLLLFTSFINNFIAVNVAVLTINGNSNFSFRIIIANGTIFIRNQHVFWVMKNKWAVNNFRLLRWFNKLKIIGVLMILQTAHWVDGGTRNHNGKVILRFMKIVRCNWHCICL